jgi:drug/metabolite transporter (DMT)-like permease
MNSTQLASVMIVGSGAAHAVVNTVLKSGKDKMSSRALIDGFSALLLLPAAFVLPLPHNAWGWAVATGVSIAVYTVIDAQGVRAAPSAQSYIVWIFLLLGGMFGVMFAIWRGPKFIVAARTEWRAGLFAGAMSVVTYGLALWAFRLGDTPRLAALRETSIVFATLLAIFVLKERVTALRLVGISCIALGAMLLLTMAAG